MRPTPFLRAISVAVLAALAAPPVARGGGDPSDGHTHGEEVAGGASVSADGAFTTSALSRRFEVVLRHAPVSAGQPYRATLYLAAFATNAPVTGATITLAEPGVAGRPFTVRATDTPGAYAVERPAGFARDGHVSLTVQVSAGGASDLLLLQDVSIGAGDVAATAPGPTSGGVPWGWLALVGALGLAFAAWLVRLARQRRRDDAVPAEAAVPVPSPFAPPPVGAEPRPVVPARRAAVPENTPARP